jgi:hypothetical protein
MTDVEPSGDPDDLIPVYVPRRLVGQVYDFVAQRMKAATGDPLPVMDSVTVSIIRAGSAPDEVYDGPVAEVPGNGRWTPGMVRHLVSQLSYDHLVQAVDLIATRAPKEIRYDEVLRLMYGASPSKEESHQLRSELGALSRTTRRLFGEKRWPFTAKQSGKTGNHMVYRMPREVADWWQDARSSAYASGESHSWGEANAEIARSKQT